MSRVVGTLEKMYRTLNDEKFGGKLPMPIITVQSKPGTWGHCSKGKIWRGKEERYEMNIAAGTLDECIEEIVDTMLHEMVHLYCRENEIQEVSRGGAYHNGKFKEIAESIGLLCVKSGSAGWNTDGANNEYLTGYCIEHGWTEFMIGREDHGGLRIPLPDLTPVQGTQQEVKTPSSTRKYKCPKCGNSFRATKDLYVICGDCNVKFEKVTKD